jgi:superfamily II DNA/RNA helicase
MTHHVLHVTKEGRVPVLAELTAAPGKTIVFTRTKHGAKALARQLNSRGVPAVELHGNLAQNARTRNLAAFGDGTATTLVATDIAARGIHVDDVGLVVHADPPVEHKAYLHRSGRTARAGAEGTVVTLMMDAQVSDVRDLTRKAGIKPTITRAQPGDALLSKIAPGERTFLAVSDRPTLTSSDERPRGNGGGGNGRGAGGRNRGGQPRAASGGDRSGSAKSGGPKSGGSKSGGSKSGGRSGGQSGGQSGGRGRSSRGGSGLVHSTSTGGGSHSAASFSSARRGR